MFDNSIVLPGEANCTDMHNIEYVPFNLILVFKLMSSQINWDEVTSAILKILNVTGFNLVIRLVWDYSSDGNIWHHRNHRNESSKLSVADFKPIWGRGCFRLLKNDIYSYYLG